MELLLDNVTKQFKDKVAVDHISLKLHPGVTGLLGANGAGKTTLMRMICGLIKISEGNITYKNFNVCQEEYRNLLGYLPQDFGYYPNFTAQEFMLYIAALKGLSKQEAGAKSKNLLEMVNLSDVANKKIKTFSGGMKQRLGIAQAVLNNPEIIILDEPTAGLDPKERVRFRNLIKNLGKDSIVILSTHICSDVEQIADRILMVNSGKIVFDGSGKDIEVNLEQLYLKEFN